MNQKISLAKYLLFCALGFGLAGFCWGWILYCQLPDLEYPFHYSVIIIMGLLGGLSLKLFSKSIKEISKAVLAGWLGFGIGLALGSVLVYPLSLISGFILSIIPFPLLEKEFTVLEPNIYIAAYWLIFLIIGAITGLFYALFLKLKIWSLIWQTGLGFALGSLIGPIIGNLLGNAFDSLLVSYLITFSLIGIILGLFLAWGNRYNA